MFNTASVSKMSGWVNFAPLKREFWGVSLKKLVRPPKNFIWGAKFEMYE
jgi:hypothetical protein